MCSTPLSSTQGELRLRPQVFDLPAMLALLVEAAQPSAAERGLRLETDFSDRLPATVMLDSLRLRQVVTNLLSNAMKYTPSGRVSLMVRLDSAAAGAAQLRIEVSDTGVGIEPERLERLFMPYAAAAGGAVATASSSGLGPSICRLVELMRGQLHITSQIGRGTRAVVLVPLQANLLPAEHELVLLCDDDDTSRLLLTHMLASRGFRVAEARSAEEALERWQQGGVGTLITDLNMHGMQGEELIAHIRAAEPADAPHTRIVVCSGNPVPDQTGPSRPLYDAYPSKPVDVGVLTETLRAFGLQAAEPATA